MQSFAKARNHTKPIQPSVSPFIRDLEPNDCNVGAALQCAPAPLAPHFPPFSPHDDGRLALLVKLHAPVNTVSEIKEQTSDL